MMKKILLIYRVILYLSFFIVCISCNEIFEEDLSKYKVKLFSPSNKVITSIQTQQFWWSRVEGASNYNIQIVTPSFDSIASLLVNSTISTDTFTFTLSPGRYQWKVTALNGFSAAKSDTFSIVIIADTAQDLRRQTLLLETPAASTATNIKDIIFTWQKLLAAKEYRVQIASPDFLNLSNIKVDKRVKGESFTASLEEGSYRWRVRAENDNTNTDYTERALTVDFTAPNAPTLLGPPIDSLSILPVILRWNADIDNSIRDTLYIYRDSTASRIILKAAQTNTTYSFRDTTANIYYWRVRSTDKAGNNSTYSPLWWFRVKK
jgi:hypothetical protein